MAEKSVDAKIAEHDAEIKKLEAEREALRVKGLPQFPKYIDVPAPPPAPARNTVKVLVQNEEEEKAARAGKAVGVKAGTSADEKRQAKEIKDAEAAVAAEKAAEDAGTSKATLKAETKAGKL